jgi:hypothetical protein
MNTNVTTAREMAQQLTTLVNTNSYKGELPTDAERFIYKHGLAIATTLDALADECEQLREALRRLCLDAGDLRVAEMRHDLIRENTTANVLRNTQIALDAGIVAANAALALEPARPQYHAPFRHATITDYLNGVISAGKLCELLGIERIVGVELVNTLMQHKENEK